MRKKYNTPHRRHVVKTRLSDEEYADFTERLAAYEISQSEFIRQAIRGATIRPVITVSPVNDGLLAALSKLTAEYGKIGGNLNQIARSLNEYGAPYTALSGEVRGAAADLAALKFEVLQKVGEAVGDKEICKERGIDPHAKAEPETAPIEQPEDAAKVADRQPTGNLTYYVAECMEFSNLGEYHDNLSLEEAVRIYQEIPAERMNGVKGIGFELKDGSDYEGPFPILTGQTIDLDTIQAIDYYRDNPLVQKAVKELAAAMPEMEVLGADANQQEALFLIDDATYLHIQSCDSGWDYTLYDAASMKELDGGQLDMPELSRKNAVLQICDDNNLDSTSLRHAPMSMIETLQEAAYQQMQAETSQMTASSQLPEAQEQALDEYPMPDEQVSTPDMQEYGYSYDGMLPVTRERALELDAAGLTVYVLHEDNTESMVFDPQEIMDHGGLFGVDHEEWEKSPQFHEKVMERQEHQQEREQAFLSQNRDCFAIYQVSRDDPQNVHFMNLDWLKSHDISIDRSNYDLIYTAPLSESGTVPEQLEKLYQQFNLEKPVDFHSPSMSVSDIVAIKQDGKVSCHYCDSVGFTQIPGFLPQNPLKNAEMAVEDDYGMIDGIINNGTKEPTVAELEQQARSGQPISLMDLADAVHREEREKKKYRCGSAEKPAQSRTQKDSTQKECGKGDLIWETLLLRK